MTFVPTSPSSVLGRSPVRGSTDEPDVAAAFVKDVSSDCSSYESGVRKARIDLAEGTSGALRRLSNKLSDSLIPGAKLLQQSADTAKSSFNSYSSEVSRIHNSAGLIVNSVEQNLNSIRGHVSTIDFIKQQIGVTDEYTWYEPPSAAMPSPRFGPHSDLDEGEQEIEAADLRSRYQEDWRWAASGWQTACASIERSKTEWEQLVTDRKNAEARLIATLVATPLGQLISLAGSGAFGNARELIAAAVSGEVRGTQLDLENFEKVGSLLDGGLAPAEVASTWQELKNDGVDTDALLEQYCFEFANLNGLPFADMDVAGRAALEYALDEFHPEQLQEAFVRMGLGKSGMSLEDFRTDLEAVRDALSDADSRRRGNDVVQLVALGQHDGATTAGLSLGNLDEASTLGVFVSGMNSNVRGIADAFNAFGEIRGGNANMAMLTWVGYRAPNIPEETFQLRADAGGIVLAAFLDGIAAQREANPIERFVVLGHSYGTNVAAEALKLTKADVDVFTTIGSAGLRYGTTAESLGVDEIYATDAKGDNIADGIGRFFHFRLGNDGGGLYEPRVDPRDLEGAREFTSEETANGKAVTMHNLVSPIEWPSWLQWLADLDGTTAADEIGYLNPQSSTVDGLGDIMRGDMK